VTRSSASTLAAVLLASGCLVGPEPALAHAPTTTTVQFDREVVHVLDDHCAMCHEERGLAFPLLSYEQTYAARWKIRQDVLDRHMAPWAAVSGYGEFANSNALTQREIDFLVSWAESFGPRNNGEVYTGIAAAPAAPKVIQAHFDFARWTLGSPDRQLTLPANTVEPLPSEAVRQITLDPGLSSDRWLRGLEYKPGDRRVVRAVSFTIRETGQWIGSWSPWYGFASLPQGLAYRLPAGSHIVAEIHYHGASEPVAERGSLALYFSNQPSARTVVTLAVNAQAVPAVPGKLLAARRLDTDVSILALQPQLAPGVQSIEVSARAPDGSIQVLLFARDVPLGWPTSYVLRRPVSLARGTELSVIEHCASDVSAPADGLSVMFTAYTGPAVATDESSAESAAQPAPAGGQRFKLTGTVKSVDAADGRLIVQHGPIPGLMGAMTMSYNARKPEDLQGVRAGDEIRSDVVVSDAGTYLEHIEVIRPAK
jgi:Cu/Ag efflux protein CusF/cytochrome c5